MLLLSRGVIIIVRGEDINSIDSESGIIASLIHNPEFSFYSEYLLPNHFTNKDNRCVYTAICDLVRKGITTIDAYNIIEDLNSSEATRKYAEDLSVEKLQELIEMSDILSRHTVEEYQMLVANVMDAALRRDMYYKLKECQSLCVNRSVEDIGQKIYDVIDTAMSEYTVSEEVPEFSDKVDELWDEIEQHQNGGCGIPFKFPTLNEYVTLEPCELVVIAAPPKGGKSILMLNTAVDVLKRGETVMYIDSELSDRLFLCRMIAHLTGIDFNKIKNGTYTQEEAVLIKEQRDWIKQQKFVHLYMPIFDQQSIYVAVKKVAHRYGKLGLLIVDYLKSTGDTDAFATYQELGRLTDMIKNDICGAMEIPGLAAAQLTKSGYLADSAKIARNASTIASVVDKSPEEIDTDGAECGNKKLIVQFNRNGMQMAPGEYIDLYFDGNHIMFAEAKQHVPQDLVPY